METKLFLQRGIIDISHIAISVQENNSKVSDQQYSKYMFPLVLKQTPEIIKILGDYVSYESNGLENKIPCLLLFENRIHEAFLFIEEGEGYDLTLQVDFGFEDLPNSEKKLSELPLESFDVADIHTFAKSICEKSWPMTNFNFPRIYTTQYPATDEVWRDFDGYLNDLKKDGTEMRRNYIQEDGQIRNVNIIHPCAHPIYLLKAGFMDAGLELAGDILTDTVLQNRWIYSGNDYFSTLTQRRIGMKVTVQDYFKSYKNKKRYYPVGEYDKSFTIPKAGNYKLMASIMLETHYSGLGTSYIRIYLNGNQIFYDGSGGEKIFNWNAEFYCPENSVVRIFGTRSYGEGDIENFVTIEMFSKDIYSNEEIEGEDNGVITNLNKIELAKAVPDITFGEFVNVFRNWFNYDVEIINKTVVMNKIGASEVTDVKDFTDFESPFPPRRRFLNKKSFLLRFPELDDGYKKDSMFYDVSGPKINGKENSETIIIDIRGYAMPLLLPKPQGYTTANVLKKGSDLVALVEYAGLQNGQNNAIYTPGCDFPELFTRDWLKWLRQRINGQEFIWRKKVNIERFSHYRIKNYIRAYNNIHIIKSLTKDKVSDNHYDIEFTTETVV